MSLPSIMIGHESTFGIEARIQIDRNEGSGSVGNVCVWIGGERVGDYDQLVVLAVVGEALSAPERCILKDSVLERAPADRVIEVVESALYGEDPRRTFAEITTDTIRHQPFCLAPGLSEAFDDEFVVLMGDVTGRRLVWRKKDSGAIREIYLAPGEYESVVGKFLDWLRKNAHYPSAT